MLARRLRHAAGRAIRGGGTEPAPATGHTLELDYPTSADNRPRWGHGQAPHPGISAILAAGDARYAAELEGLLEHLPDLARISVDEVRDTMEPHWAQDWMTGLDGVSIYGYLRSRRPRRYVEVGSGISTRFAARAKRDGGLETHITSIDPHPRAEVDQLCDQVIRAPLEGVDLAEAFGGLVPGDVVLFDGSHRVFMNSDVAVFFLEVLPALPGGVLVGIDDILWPDDYFPDWAERHYSEQYLLGAYLLAGCPWLVPVLPSRYVEAHPDLRQIIGPFFDRPEMAEVSRLGLIFWSEIRR